MHFFFIFISFCIINCEESSKEVNNELKSVVIIYRHGDKAPAKSYPSDPYCDKKYWPMGLGQLTNQGKERMYNLGKWLRTTYEDFLPVMYSPEDVYVYSTDYDRTLMSAGANLAGLYPPRSVQTWNEHLLWQPLPIHTMPDRYDEVLCASENCPKYPRLYDELDQSEFFKGLNRDYSNMYKLLSNYTGWNVTDVYYFSVIQSAFYAYAQANASYIPEWYETFDPTVVEFLAALYYSKYSFTPELSKLGNGVFFYKLLEHFDAAVRNTKTSTKLLMYSAHESNVASILNSFGVFNYKVPQFGAAVIWELRRSVDKYFVNMLYKQNDTYIEELVLPKIKCGFHCDYGIFRTMLERKALFPDQRPAACANID